MLLDIEERIYIGSLGATKVKDRMSWKNCIEQGGYEPQDPEMKWRNGGSQSSDSSQGTDTMDVDELENDRGVSVVKDLARALIQIERGLDRKYLNSPLSTNTDSKKTKKSTQEGGKKKKEEDSSDDDDEEETKKTPVERWEDGLLSCRSLPQLFLYLSVLEKSIIWSKSALHARCRICRRKGDADKMLLCDACDRGHHMFCLKPPVKNVPRGDWFCPQCRPKLQKPRTPRKNRKSFCEEPEPESSDSDDESDEEEEDDDSDVDSSDDEEEASTEEDEEDEDTEVGTEDEWEDQPTKIKLKAHPKRKEAKQSEASSGGQKSASSSGQKSASSSRNSTPKQTAGGSRSSTPKESGGGSSSRSRTTKRVSMDTSLELPKSRSGRGSARNSLEPEPRSSSKNDKSSSKKSRPDSRPSSAKRDGQKSDSKANKRKRDSTEPMEGDGSPALKKTATKSRGGEWADQMKLAENLVHELIQHDESWPFLKPVTRKEAPDYFEIIKTPMDLCTIRAKINKFEYKSPVSILEDIQLVFRNCEAYNLQTSEEYKAGQRLVKLFVQRVKDMKLDDLIRKSVQSNGDSSSGRSLRRH